MKALRTSGIAIVLVFCVLPVALGAEKPAGKPARDQSLLLESRAAVDRALRYLKTSQQPDGSWKGDPAITALVVTAMVGSGQAEFNSRGELVQKALTYIRGFAKPDGSIYDKFYQNYTTSICVMALIEAGQPEDKERLRRAQNFLLGLQADETEDITKDDPQYGGWGYEKDVSGEGMHRPDMSNTQTALEAVRALREVCEEDKAVGGSGAAEAAVKKTDLAFQKATLYLQRCQNEDGGFIYRPGESFAGKTDEGGLRSYGSMTYAGLKSMIHARLDRDDRRVIAAYDWAKKHWTVTENAPLGDQGLYYYYQTMAKALNVYGEESIVDAQGKPHDWRAELAGQLLKIQRADGSWVNGNGRWMESMPELATAYSTLALEHATRNW